MTEIAKAPIVLDDAGSAIKLAAKDGSAISLKNVHVGLGWDKGVTATAVDIDLHVVLLDSVKTSKLLRQPDGEYQVYYANKTSACGSIVLDKDNRTGEGDGYDENVNINLETIPADINALAIVINIFSGGTFGRIRNAFVDVNAPGMDSIRADLTEDYSAATAIHIANIYRLDDGVWRVKKIGDGLPNGIVPLLKSFS